MGNIQLFIADYLRNTRGTGGLSAVVRETPAGTPPGSPYRSALDAILHRIGFVRPLDMTNQYMSARLGLWLK